VERQYKYLARLEAEVSTLYGSDLLSRESKSYQANYPVFLAWMHVVYTWLFPGAVVILSVLNAAAEVSRLGAKSIWNWGVLLLAAINVVTVVLYVYSAKSGSVSKTPAREGPQRA
jgi:hypothetical protein